MNDNLTEAKSSNVENDGWGHKQRPKEGGRRWGPPPEDFQIHFDQPEVIAHGLPARVENLGTAQKPRIKFFIPYGAPGKDAPQDRGLTGTHLGLEIKNGLVKTVDYTIRPVRSFIAEGYGVDVSYEFTDAGAISISINADKLRELVVTELEASFKPRIEMLEKAVSFDDFKKAVESFAEDYRNKLTEMSEMKLAFHTLKAEYETLKLIIMNHIGPA